MPNVLTIISKTIPKYSRPNNLDVRILVHIYGFFIARSLFQRSWRMEQRRQRLPNLEAAIMHASLVLYTS